MNTRKIRRFRPDRSIYRLLAMKSGRLLYLESWLELLWAYYLDRHPDVIWFHMQQVSYIYGLPKDSPRRERRYTPDVIVRFPHGREAYEIKPASLVDDKLKNKIGYLDGRLNRDFGMTLSIKTDEDLKIRVHLGNLPLLRRFCREDVDPITLSEVRRQARVGDTIQSLADRLQHSGVHAALVWTAVAKGFLRVDETQPITGNSAVEVV